MHLNSLRVIPYLGVLCALLLFHSADASDVVQMPEEFVTGRAPEGFVGPATGGTGVTLSELGKAELGKERVREGATALNGNFYTVIAPTFDGSDGNVSYFRFVNLSGGTATVSVNVVGHPSALTYGTATLFIPNLASPQYSMNEILSTSGSGSLLAGDVGFSFYVSSPQAGNYVGFQHVIYNASNGFFENISVCTFDPNFDYSAINQGIINVHTSLLSAFPTLVFIHNYANVDRDYRVTVVDARTGVIQGTVDIGTTANTSYASPMSFFEEQIGWEPGSNQQHANLFFEPLSIGGPYDAVVGQAIQNSNFNSLVNMTQVCGINR